MERVNVIAHGRVQGVFFRDATARAARSRGVAGWVRNRDDGTVQAVFEGEHEDVAAMVEAVRRGPGRAEVARVDVETEEPEGLDGFEIV